MTAYDRQYMRQFVSQAVSSASFAPTCALLFVQSRIVFQDGTLKPSTRTRRGHAMICGIHKVLSFTLLRVYFPLLYRSFTQFLVSKATRLRCLELCGFGSSLALCATSISL